MKKIYSVIAIVCIIVLACAACAPTTETASGNSAANTPAATPAETAAPSDSDEAVQSVSVESAPTSFDGSWQAVATEYQDNLSQDGTWFLVIQGGTAYEYADGQSFADDTPTGSYEIEILPDGTAQMMVGAASASGNIPEDFVSALTLYGSNSLSCEAYRDTFTMDRIAGAAAPGQEAALDGRWKVVSTEQYDLEEDQIWYLEIGGNTAKVYDDRQSPDNQTPTATYDIEMQADGMAHMMMGAASTSGNVPEDFYATLSLLYDKSTMRCQAYRDTFIMQREASH